MQWFVFAAIALIIYVLALRKRLKEAKPRAMTEAAPPGQWPDASRSTRCPAREIGAIGLYARGRLALRAGGI